MGTEFRVLGPVEVRSGGVLVPITGAKRGLLMAVLLTRANRVVAVDTLVEALWPSRQPASARGLIHNYVSQLRKLIQPDVLNGGPGQLLATVPPGYRLTVRSESVDSKRFEDLLAAARSSGACADTAEAADFLSEALAMWRGPALADVADHDMIRPEAQRLEALRQLALEERIEALIALGRHAELVSELEGLVRDQPLHERLCAQLMRCLYRSGRQADALAVVRQLRTRLRDELGLAPDRELVRLEHDILCHTVPSVTPPPSARERPSRSPSLPGEEEPSSRSHVGGLPAPISNLIGREQDLDAVCDLLQHERLITVVGPGGVGKTHLSIEAAIRGSGRRTVLFLAGSTVSDPAGLTSLLAQQLNLTAATEDVVAAATAVLRSQDHLLMVDNCEHLLVGVRDLLVSLLEACPRLHVLATSRERLGLPVEQCFVLHPLPVPASHDNDVQLTAAVSLFIDRARRARPDFSKDPANLATIGDIVRHLDGLPLAIELAAGRLSSLSLDDLHGRIERALDLLQGSRTTNDSRHATLRATLAWSYQLLDDSQRRLFRQLAVFADGFDLAAVEHIATRLDPPVDPVRTLGRLVDASMITASLTGTPRYRMLHPLRAFGLERLDDEDERPDAERRLQHWATDLLHWFDRSIDGPDEASADRRLRAELGNLRAVWRITRRNGDLDGAIDMVTALYFAAKMRGLFEILEWALELAAEPAVRRDPEWATCLALAADAAMVMGDHDGAEQLIATSMAIAGDRGGDGQVARLFVRSSCHLLAGDFERARDVPVLCDDGGPLGLSVVSAALAATYSGETPAPELLNQLHARSSPSRKAWYEYIAGELDGRATSWDSAESHYQAALRLASVGGATFIEGIALVGLASVQAARGEANTALAGYRELLTYWERTASWTFQATTLRNLAALLAKLGATEVARFLWAAADGEPEHGPPTFDDEHLRREHVLRVAREAIDRHLQQQACTAGIAAATPHPWQHLREPAREG